MKRTDRPGRVAPPVQGRVAPHLAWRAARLLRRYLASRSLIRCPGTALAGPSSAARDLGPLLQYAAFVMQHRMAPAALPEPIAHFVPKKGEHLSKGPRFGRRAVDAGSSGARAPRRPDRKPR
jgi:hypothetical protein